MSGKSESEVLFVGQNYFFETGVASGHVSDYFYPNGDPHGMERGVIPLAPVAPSTHHCGLMYDCLLPQLIT